MLVFISWTIILPFRKKKKNGGHRTNYLSGGPNLTPPPHIMRIIQYKTLRSDFCPLYITYYLYEVTQHNNANKRRKLKQGVISAHPGTRNQPLSSGFKVQHANH